MSSSYPDPGRLVNGPIEDRDHQLVRLRRFERLGDPVLAALPYGMLVVANVLTLAYSATRPYAPQLLIVSAALAGWMLFMFTLRPGWRDRRVIMSVFMIVWVALTGVLVSTDGWFGFFSFTGYFLAFWALRGAPRAAAIIACAVLTGTAQSGGLPGVGPDSGPVYVWAVIVSVNVFVGGGLNWFASVSDRQTARRQELLAELSEANDKLAATLRENAGLQAQLVAQAREAGVADERQRMAREIHDTIAQGLAGIITQLQAAERAEQAGPDSERRRHLTAAAELARESLTEARRAVRELRPEALEPGKLEDALRHVAGRWERLHQVPVSVTSTGPPRPLDPQSEVVLLRVAQEALANVAKHAHASRVGLTLSYMSDLVTLDIRDDGVGFATPGVPSQIEMPVGRSLGNGASTDPSARSAGDGHFGLTGMRERADGIGGTVEIESEPGGGTAISVSVPAGLPGLPAEPAPLAATGIQ